MTLHRTTSKLSTRTKRTPRRLGRVFGSKSVIAMSLEKHWGRIAMHKGKRRILNPALVEAISEREFQEVEQTQLNLYSDMVMARVKDRFETRSDAEKWFSTVSIPGYGKTARQLVAAGHAAWVIEYINSVEAGVYA